MSGRNRDNRNNRYNDEHDHRSPDRSRTREKPYNDRNNQHNRDYGNDQGRDRWQRGNSPRNDKEKRNYRNYNNNNYNNRNRDWNQESKREVPKVFEMEVDVPKTFVLAEKGELKGKIITNLIIAEKQPQRLETSRLGELKSKITPIERIWTSHIKQYLNDSEFVQIHRKGRSLAYGQIEYGRSLIRYDERQNDICYDNKLYQAPIFSRAYFKLWEILKMGVLDKYENKQLTIGCIAEGPGGFIHALIDYRQKQHAKSDASPKDHFHAITLKIDSNTRNAKDWSDSRGTQLFSRLRKFGWKIGLSYGSTGTGNLLLRQNIQHFQKQVGKKCLVVTGDGGIECIGDKQFQYQEIFNAKLFFAEIITALHIQEVTGFFILKIYDCGFELTRQLILLLALYYKVQIVKPVTSRPGNSEKYLLCEDFAGIAEDELNELKRVLQEWTKAEPNLSYFENKTFLQNVFDFKNMQNYDLIYEKIKQANDVFVKQQEFKLEEGLNLAARLSNVEQIEEQLRKSRFQEQVSFAYAWCKKYGLSTIDVQVTTKGTVNEQI